MKRTAPPWKLPASGRVLLLLALAAAPGCDPAQKQKPVTDLTATPEAVTLIQETKERCVKVAKTGLERVRSAESEQQRVREAAYETARENGDPRLPRTTSSEVSSVTQETLEKYLQDEAAPELAAVDRAGELLRDLLPKVKEEAPAEIHQAVQALSTSQQQVCTRIRNARSSQASYQDNLDYAVRDYDNAEAKLQTLYTVNATDAQFALSKFNPLLDQARAAVDRHPNDPLRSLTSDQVRKQRKEWEATQELQQQQQAEHDAAVLRWRQRQEGKMPILAKVGVAPELAAKQNLPPEKRQQTMQSWNAHYAGKVAPVREALANYMSLRRVGTDAQLQPVCQALMDATSALNADAAALDPPDVTAVRALKKSYTNLQEVARACLNGQSAEAAFRLAAYQGALAEATTALQPYNVTP